jgi:hypothetical protein
VLESIKFWCNHRKQTNVIYHGNNIIGCDLFRSIHNIRGKDVIYVYDKNGSFEKYYYDRTIRNQYLLICKILVMFIF